MGGTDVFENVYMAKLKALLVDQGVVIDYERDRAAIDTGLHLFVEAENHTQAASPVRVWFQAKGRTTQVLALEAYRAADAVAVELKMEHLKFWYAFPEPVYVTIYVEAADEFLAEDVRDLVDRVWPGGTFYEAAASQETVTVHVPVTAVLDRARLEGMLRHRSMRIDGPAFRGRPLGHRFDPTRSVLADQVSGVWDRVVEQLLAAHDFRPTRTVTVSNHLSIVEGWLYETMSWQSPAYATYGYQHHPMEFREDPPYETLQRDLRIVLDSAPSRQRLTDDEREAVLRAASSGAIASEPLEPLDGTF